ncbi:hypothetical protein F4X86_03455 [Candidatus Saccharibacteria bacterium]|nr:hypothetical protein [Candidatus Saccharibacteria bacterium]
MGNNFLYFNNYFGDRPGAGAFDDENYNGHLNHRPPGDNPPDPDGAYQRISDSISADSVDKVQALDNFPTDNEIEEFLRWKQINPQRNSYQYWAFNLPTKDDRQSLQPLYGAVFYDQLVNLIKSKVKVLSLPEMEGQGEDRLVTAQILNNYRHYLSQKSASFQLAAASNDYPHVSNDLFSLNGLNLAEGDQVHDLSLEHAAKAGLMSNIISAEKEFVTHCTAGLLHAYLLNQVVPLQYCIYLNPQISQSVRVVTELINKFEDSRLVVKTDILNRAIEGGSHHILDIKSWSIAVYVNKAQVDYALDLILGHYKQDYLAFDGRTVPKLAASVAHGIAVSTQEGFDQDRYSFNGHRSNMFDITYKEFEYYQMSASSVTHHDIQTFKQILQRECGKHQVDVRNIAFPDPMTFRS